MRRIALTALVAAVAAVALIVALANGDERYFVRAVFDNASTLVPGEDVKVAGVPVGEVADMDVTEDRRALVRLRIDDPDFVPWRADARCTIGSQGLIGEKFVDCQPGTTAAEPLPAVESGEGEGDRLLPVERTSSPVDLDLVNDIMRLPFRQRFAILLSEFGTGLAGRGEELREVIHRANPALRETDEVLAVLAKQNRVLAQLARDSDAALAPLARERESLADFVVQANRTGEASAERRGDLRRSIELLPDFLAELRPLMADLEDLADEGTPLLDDLGAAAPALGRLIRAQGTLADASRESFPSLGDALERGRPALIDARPLIRDLRRLGREAAPVSVRLDELTRSLESTNAIERLNDVLYYLALASNGFDGMGHYLRAGLVTNVCSTYALEPSSACRSTFFDPAAEISSASAAGSVPALTAQAGRERSEGSVAPTGSLLQELLGQAGAPGLAERRDDNMDALRRRHEAGGSPALDPAEPALEYLLGSDGP